jgi:hypothetical protein
METEQVFNSNLTHLTTREDLGAEILSLFRKLPFVSRQVKALFYMATCLLFLVRTRVDMHC